MAKIETLTAYKCKFSYLERNNPLIAEQRKAIKSGESPQYAFSDFLTDYIEISSKLAIGENTDRAILLPSEKSTTEDMGNNVIRWHLLPRSGKQGKPVTVMKTSTLKEYNFGSDSAALYDHHIFIYVSSDSIIAIFHRQNGSGCKSVFLETANKVLKPKGLKLEMNLFVPISDSLSNATPTKITLQYTRTVASSDVADNYNGRKERKQVIRDLGLNLEVTDNNSVFKIFKNMQLGKIEQEAAFAQIKAECSNADEYNDAEVKLRIGKSNKILKWNEFERFFGSHDISESLHAAYKKPEDFIPALTKLTDEYYYSIVETADFEHVD
ncbi:MAG: hypothetical protein ACQGTM_14325 [bacterium]|jgi:hypothetical protein